MLLKTILNRVASCKSFVYKKVRIVETPTAFELEVQVAARANGRPICSGCGEHAPGYDRPRQGRSFRAALAPHHGRARLAKAAADVGSTAHAWQFDWLERLSAISLRPSGSKPAGLAVSFAPGLSSGREIPVLTG